MVLIPQRPNPLRFRWGNPCIACLSFWLKAFRTESRTFRGCFNQPKEWCFTGIYGQFEIAKHQNTNQLGKKYQQQNKKLLILLILIDPLHLLVEVLFYYDEFHLHYIKLSHHFLISWSCISETILTLTPEVSHICWIHVVHVNSSWRSLFPISKEELDTCLLARSVCC